MRTILRDNYEPVMGAYHEVLLIDEAQNKRWLFDCDGVFTELPAPGCIENEKGDSETCAISQKAFTDEVDKLDLALTSETAERKAEDKAIWDEIEEIEMSSDVVDIVGTYADLQAYDTSHLNNNDIIKVISDESHDDATSYYRYTKSTDTFSYVGSEGPYYTESEVDTLLGGKQDTLTAGTNITITNNTISATDTTYQDFAGATSGAAGTSGLVPAPAAGDEGKFLKGDGTWDDAAGSTYTAGSGIDITNDVISVDTTVVQEKLTAGTNIQINGNTISATDTTYADFVGTDGQTAGTHGLVPAPAVADAGEFLKADGTWATPPGTTYAAGTGIDITNNTIAVDTAVIQEKLTAGSNISINNGTISATDTTYSNFGGATSSVAGSAGLVPAPTTSDPDKYLKGDGTWSSIPATNNISSNDWSGLWQ